jgi:hypothetical protein
MEEKSDIRGEHRYSKITFSHKSKTNYQESREYAFNDIMRWSGILFSF